MSYNATQAGSFVSSNIQLIIQMHIPKQYLKLEQVQLMNPQVQIIVQHL
jgi:hypothetical protein